MQMISPSSPATNPISSRLEVDTPERGSRSRSITGQIRVLMLEDSAADAELIHDELRRAGLMPVVERVDSAEKFESALTDFLPDVVLADYSLAQADAQAAYDLVRKICPTTPMIIVTGSMNGDGKAVHFLRAGVDDLIVKDNISRLPASITDALELRRPLAKLTPRQVEVLRMVAEGHRTREIATRLNLSIKTIESHRGEIMKRLDIHDLVNLVRYAMRLGLVRMGSEAA
jgi:DNA-binding NarL/FixJ family response regulator